MVFPSCCAGSGMVSSHYLHLFLLHHQAMTFLPVGQQVTGGVESVATHSTCIRPFTCVFSLVDCEAGGLGETEGTDVASVRSFS